MEEIVYEIYKEAFEIRMPSWFLNYSQEEIFKYGTDYGGEMMERIFPLEDDDDEDFREVTARIQRHTADDTFDTYRSLATTCCTTSFTGKPLLTGYLYWMGEFHYVDDDLDYFEVIDYAAEPYFANTEDDDDDDGRWTPVRGFNTKQWWVYDEKDDCYIDPPKAVLDNFVGYGADYDAQEKIIRDLCKDRPDWLFDEDYRYYSDFEI